MKYLALAVLFLLSLNTSAQILNAESLRKVTDTSGWSGSLSANFALKRNVNDFLVLGTDAHIQYKKLKHLVIFKNDIRFQKIEGNKFENSGITHVRYNYRFKPRIAWEVFTQGQYNKVNLIQFRGLIGTGPRFKLTTSEKYKFYLGTLAMYEYEEVTDNVTPLQQNLRGSAYLSLSLYPSDRVTLVSTTYYQPLLNQFSDYRISSQSSLLVGLFKNLSLKTTYTFTYDVFPAVGIPNSQYDFSTGVAYTFD
ncbi:MAG: DUF481 domain-containing protein [Bacteroidota bacterium]